MQAWEVWLKAALTKVQVPPLRPRVSLLANGEVIGSVEPDFLRPFAIKGNASMHQSLQKSEQFGDQVIWDIQGDVSAGLAELAHAMREASLTGPWRNELLRVKNQTGRQLALIERAAVRPLGISTEAVHLVGFAPDGRLWVQQRALDKANDPGLWDTLMGGMVSAQDNLQQALVRETWEEAGLRLEQLDDVAHRGFISFASPAHDGSGAGYLVERIDWYSATVPRNVEPVNQDGEVAQFACLTRDEVLEMMGEYKFTLEAGLILAAALGLDAV